MSCITGKSDSVEDDDGLLTQLDAIYQVLTPHMYHFCLIKRKNEHINLCYPANEIITIYIIFVPLQKLLQMFENKKVRVKEISSSNKLFSGSNLSMCCSYSNETLGHTSGYNTWRDTSPLVDNTSFALDMKLLVELSHVLLIDPKKMQQVRSSVLLYSVGIYNYELFVFRVYELFGILNLLQTIPIVCLSSVWELRNM